MVVAFFLAAFGGGPFPFLLLLPPTIVMSIQILLDGFGKKKAVFPRSARVIAGIGFAVFVVLTVKTVTIHATRSPVDLVLKWNSAASPKRIIGDLVLRGREALPELRRIIAEGGDIAVSSTVDILAEYGEAEWSVPLLIEVMEEREDYSQHVQSRLREVTGLELSKSSSATEWKLAWQKRLEEERTPPPLSVGK
jgi:hypothetical protein